MKVYTIKLDRNTVVWRLVITDLGGVKNLVLSRGDDEILDCFVDTVCTLNDIARMIDPYMM